VIRDLEVRDTGATGLGVFARRSFVQGEPIFRRRHRRVVDATGLRTLTDAERVHVCQLAEDRFGLVAPPGAHVNHARDPNAMRHGVAVFAWHSIAAGEEIRLDYRINAVDGDSWPCACGTKRCTGTVVGSFFALPRALQDRYLPHAAPFVRREVQRRRLLDNRA
jgi:hypothetical protein